MTFRWPWEPDPRVGEALAHLVAILGEPMVMGTLAAIHRDYHRREQQDMLLAGDDTRPCPQCKKRDSILRDHNTEEIWRNGIPLVVRRGGVRFCIFCGTSFYTNERGSFPIPPEAMGHALPTSAPVTDDMEAEVKRATKGLPRDEEPPKFLERPGV